LQDAFHIRARDLGDKTRVINARTVILQILVEAGDRLVKRDRESGLGVELRFLAHIDVNQRDARPRKPLQRALADLAELGVEIVPKMLVRHADAQPLQRGRRDLERPAGHDAVNQHTVGDAAGHGAGGIAGVRDRDDAGLRPASGSRAKTDDAAQRRRDTH